MGIRDCHWYDVTTLRAGLAPVQIIDVSSLEEIQSARGLYPSLRILGGGSNTIGLDEKEGVVLLHLKQPFAVEKLGDDCVRVPAGSATSLVIMELARCHGLGGMSALSGIPGSLGGGCAMNAGANGFEISQFIREMEGISLSDGTFWQWHSGDGGFGYRRSPIPGKVVVTSVVLGLKKVDAGMEMSAIGDEKKRRREKNPQFPSAGSVFKNPGGDYPSAGKLLEEAGCKGLRRGLLEVSGQHANWIVNPEGKPAAASDARFLVDEMRRRVLERFGVELKTEWRFC